MSDVDFGRWKEGSNGTFPTPVRVSVIGAGKATQREVEMAKKTHRSGRGKISRWSGSEAGAFCPPRYSLPDGNIPVFRGFQGESWIEGLFGMD